MQPDNNIDSSLKSDRLRELLRQSIADTPLKAGDQLPSEADLAARYNVSRSTVREAITTLVQEGILNRIHGRGTFVAEARPRLRTLAVVTPYLFFSDEAPFGAGTDVIPRLMQAIERAAHRLDANILLYLGSHRAERERENIENIVMRRVDGVLLNVMDGAANHGATRIREAGIPLVLVDRYLPDQPVDFVVTDNELGAYRATRRLIDHGFSRVVFTTSRRRNTSLIDRRAGYERAIAEAGLAPHIFFVEKSAPETADMDAGNEQALAFRLTNALFAETEAPFAIFSADAPILAGIWWSIQENGLPFDNLAFACFDEPYIVFPKSLLTLKVIQPFAELGQRSMEILAERIAGTGSSEQRRVFVEPEIIVNKV